MSSIDQGEVDVRDETEAHLRAAQDLARAARALCDSVIRMPAGPASEEFARGVRELSRQMEEHLVPGLTPWYYDDARTSRATAEERQESLLDKDELSDFSPVIPRVKMRVDGDQATGTVRAGPAFTGPPGRVHGGVLSTILDHAMGLLVSVAAQPSVTARLEIDFVGGAPIDTELQVAVRIDERAGRKTWVAAEILSGGEVCVRARGLFVAPGSR